jgi:hypothetical protein
MISPNDWALFYNQILAIAGISFITPPPPKLVIPAEAGTSQAKKNEDL